MAVEIHDYLQARHDFSFKSFIKWWTGIILLLPLCVAIMYAINVVFNYAMPVTYWFEYDRIETVELEYGLAYQQLNFKSFSNYKHNGLNISYNDEIVCVSQVTGQWDVYAHDTSGPYVRNKSDNTDTPAMWTMHVILPNYPTGCKLVSHPSVTLLGGITKVFNVKDTHFIVAMDGTRPGDAY